MDVTAGSWNSFDIDLDAFSGVDLANVFQMKFDSQDAVIGSTDGLSTFYMDNLYFSNNTPTVGTPPLNITFESNDSVGFITAFEGATGEVVSASSSAALSSDAGAVTKGTTSQPWGGATFVNLNGSGELISDGSELVSMKVFSPQDAVKVALKLEDSTDATKFVLLEATTESNNGAVAWETLEWDFSNAQNLDHSINYDKASVFFDYLEPQTGETYYFDDVTFNGYVA
ncbi:hypothetical protein XMA152_002484 [Marinobacterium sp. xm-a-152]|nr:hypothetical protein [Marinobacterium sp. xm-a-152]